MPINMPCPHCGHGLSVPDRMAGKKAGCVHCKGRFVVPDATAQTVALSAPIVEDPNAGLPGDANLPSDIIMPTSLSSLERMDIDGAEEDLSPAFAKAAEAESAATRGVDADALGCVYWGLAFYVPPAALVWSFFLPKGHPQKGMAMGVSGGFAILGIALIVVLG